MSKPGLKIKIDAKTNAVRIEPLESLWKEMRHTRATLIYLKTLLSKQGANTHKSIWQQEVIDLESSLTFIQKKFNENYLLGLCVLREFEITKYDRAFLEIAFTNQVQS